MIPSIQGKRQPEQIFSFSEATDLSISLHLNQGVNELGFFILEAAEGSVQLEGDARVFLARVDRMTIEPHP